MEDWKNSLLKKYFGIILVGLFLLSLVSASWEDSEKPFNQQYFEDCWNNLNPDCFILGTFNGRPRTPNVPITSAGSTSGCTDSDGGWNLFARGGIFVKDYYSTGNDATLYDECLDSNTLRERFCSSTSSFRFDAGSIDYECNLGCVSDRCVKLQCIDSDGGFNLDEQGEITAPGDPLNGAQDFCTDDILTEYSCGEDRVQVTEQACIKGCSSGECDIYELPPIEGGKGALGQGSPDEIPEEWCLSCYFNGKCYPFGAKFEFEGLNYYCDVSTSEKIRQKGFGVSCTEDYECVDNLCLGGVCQDLEVLTDNINFFKDTWATIVCSITSPGALQSCKADMLINQNP